MARGRCYDPRSLLRFTVEKGLRGMKRIHFVLGLVWLAVVVAAPVAAQTNVGVISEERVLRESAVGVHIRTRLAAIAKTVEDELAAIGEPIQKERDALSAETSTLTQDAVQQDPELMRRIGALNASAQQFEVERRVRQQELVQTERQAMRPVYEAMKEVLEQVVADRNVDVLVDRSNLVFASPAVDVSDDVIALLNERLSTVPVERVRLPRGAAGEAQ